MDERAQTYSLRPNDPSMKLFVRMLRLYAIPFLAIGLALYATGVLSLLATLVFPLVVVIDFIVIPLVLRARPLTVSIDRNGVTRPGRFGGWSIPWNDIQDIDLAGEADRGWLYKLLFVDPVMSHVRITIPPDSETRRTKQLKFVRLYVLDPDQFVRDTKELRGQA